MKIEWSRKAVLDLVRLHDFVAVINPPKARQIIFALNDAALLLGTSPRMGSRLDGFGNAEVRRVIVSNYELRYEITEDVIFVLRIWHTREDR